MRQPAVISMLWFCGTGVLCAQEQPAPVIGWLTPATTLSYQQSGPGGPGPRPLRDRRAKPTLIAGKNARLAMRPAEGKLDRLPGLAEALVRDGATVILAFGEAAGRAAQAATRTLPIVCVGDDLVHSGLAASLARPGSNMTGVSILATELDAKKIEVLKELLRMPSASASSTIRRPAVESAHKKWLKLRAISVSDSRRSTSVALTTWSLPFRLYGRVTPKESISSRRQC